MVFRFREILIIFVKDEILLKWIDFSLFSCCCCFLSQKLQQQQFLLSWFQHIYNEKRFIVIFSQHSNKVSFSFSFFLLIEYYISSNDVIGFDFCVPFPLCIQSKDLFLKRKMIKRPKFFLRVPSEVPWESFKILKKPAIKNLFYRQEH